MFGQPIAQDGTCSKVRSFVFLTFSARPLYYSPNKTCQNSAMNPDSLETYSQQLTTGQ